MIRALQHGLQRLLPLLRPRPADPTCPVPTAWIGRWHAGVALAERAAAFDHVSQIHLRLRPAPEILAVRWIGTPPAHARAAATAEIAGWLALPFVLPRRATTGASLILHPGHGAFVRIGDTDQALEIRGRRRPDGSLHLSPEGWSGPGASDR